MDLPRLSFAVLSSDLAAGKALIRAVGQPLSVEPPADYNCAVARFDYFTESTEKEAMSGPSERAIEPVERNNLKQIFAVGSGKGGVGKSTVAAWLALGLKQRGASVGLMDADAYGPSIPHLLGVRGRPGMVEVDGKPLIEPIQVNGLRIMSLGFFIEEGRPAIWRGPMLDGLIRQFLSDVNWGQLDYLVVDLPPTTGDVPLSLAQRIALSGAVVVCTPQDVALLDAVRALNMFRELKVPVLGLVENMSGFVCPHCGASSQIFGSGGVRDKAEQLGLPFLGQIPILLDARELGDAGRLAENLAEGSPVRPYVLEICDRLVEQLEQVGAAEQQLPTLE